MTEVAFERAHKESPDGRNPSADTVYTYYRVKVVFLYCCAFVLEMDLNRHGGNPSSVADATSEGAISPAAVTPSQYELYDLKIGSRLML
jgi:hypothetical protein